MQRSDFVRARIEPELKKLAEGVLVELGITPSQAINMLYRSIAREHGWPLELKIPNEVTAKALRETDNGVDLNPADDTNDLFRKLGI